MSSDEAKWRGGGLLKGFGVAFLVGALGCCLWMAPGCGKEPSGPSETPPVPEGVAETKTETKPEKVKSPAELRKEAESARTAVALMKERVSLLRGVRRHYGFFAKAQVAQEMGEEELVKGSYGKAALLFAEAEKAYRQLQESEEGFKDTLPSKVQAEAARTDVERQKLQRYAKKEFNQGLQQLAEGEQQVKWRDYAEAKKSFVAAKGLFVKADAVARQRKPAFEAERKCVLALERANLLEESMREFGGALTKSALAKLDAARASFAKGDYVTSAAEYREVPGLLEGAGPELVPGMYKKAQKQLQEKQIVMAHHLWQQVLKLDPSYDNASRCPGFFGLAKSPRPMYGGGPGHSFQDPHNTVEVPGSWTSISGYDLGASIGADESAYCRASQSDCLVKVVEREIVWAVELTEGVWSVPSVSADGTVYVWTRSKKVGNLHAVSPDGRIEWSTRLPGGRASSCFIAADGTIYVLSSDMICAVSPRGELKWHRGKDHNGRAFGSRGHFVVPAIGPEGNIYTVAGLRTVCALDRNGKTKWQFDSRHSCDTLAVGPEGTLYVAYSGDHLLYAIAPTGELKWKAVPNSDKGRWGGPARLAVGRDGTVIITASIGPKRVGHVYAVSPAGEVKWDCRVGSERDFGSGEFQPVGFQPVIGGDGTVYLKKKGHNRMLAIKADGKSIQQITWRKDEVKITDWDPNAKRE